MKLYQLDTEEEEILKAYQQGKFKRTDNFDQEKRKLEKIAANSSNKTKNINLRISEKDLQKLKTKAEEEGIPYQTLASSILHRYVRE